MLIKNKHTQLLGYSATFPDSNTDPVFQIIGALLLSFTPIHTRFVFSPAMPKSFLAEQSKTNARASISFHTSYSLGKLVYLDELPSISINTKIGFPDTQNKLAFKQIT